MAGRDEVECVMLIDISHDMLAAIVQSVGVTAGLPALASAAASHRLLAEAARRDDVWRFLLQHELGIEGSSMRTPGGSCVSLLRALKLPPSRLVTAHSVGQPRRHGAVFDPKTRGLTATFPVPPPIGRDHCVRA